LAGLLIWPSLAAQGGAHVQDENQAAEEMGLEGAQHHIKQKNTSLRNDTES